MRPAVRLAALAILVLLALRLRELWLRSPVDLSSANVTLLVGAALVSLAAVVSYGLVWPQILVRLGVAPPRRAMSLFLHSQIGKYLPGSVWHYAGRVGLARARGVPVRVTLASLGIEVGASVLAAGVVGVFVLPLPLAATLALALLVALRLSVAGRIGVHFVEPLLRLVRRLVPVDSEAVRASVRTLPPATALYVPVWIVYGLALWLTARALFPVPAGDIAYFTAAFALGWIAGMVAVFAPGGIGVREVVLVALLAPRVGEAEAIVIAGASRIMLTTADLAGGAGALVWDRLSRPLELTETS